MKKNKLAILLCIGLILVLLPTTAMASDSPFTDVTPLDWYHNEVTYVYENELMYGIGEKLFAPESAATRAMFATVLWRMEGSPAPKGGDKPFSDVEDGAYYHDAVLWTTENNIAEGYGNGSFGSEDPLIREQMAVMLYRYVQYRGLGVSLGADANILGYYDAASVSQYAVSALEWACSAGLIQGAGGKLMPRDNTLRGQLAVVFYRLCRLHTVTFDQNDETADVYRSMTVTEGMAVSAPEAPLCSDYAFVGWSSKADSSTLFDFDTPITADLTLYARWQYIGLPLVEDSGVITDEGNIPNLGSQYETAATKPIGAITSGSFEMQLFAVDASVTIDDTELKTADDKLYYNNVEVTPDTMVSAADGTHGTLMVTGMNDDGTVEYLYILNKPVDATGKPSNKPGTGDAGRGEATVADIFDVIIKTVNGTVTRQITVEALDDGPLVREMSVPKATIVDTDNTLTGTLDFTPGADAADSQVTVKVEGQTFTGTKTAGEWTFIGGIDHSSFIMEGTAFTYTRPTSNITDGVNDEIFLEVTVTDGDGDDVQQSLEVNSTINPLFNGASSGKSSGVTTDEGNIPNLGSQYETVATEPFGTTTSGSFELQLYGADATVTIGETALNVKNGKLYHNDIEVTENSYISINGDAHGILMVKGMDDDETVHYSYTLTNPVNAKGKPSNNSDTGEAGRGEAAVADIFDVIIKTVNGTATGQILAEALDDGPLVREMSVPKATIVDTDNTLTGTLDFTPGADAADSQVTVKVEGQTFTGTKTAGKWTFIGGSDHSSFIMEGTAFTYTRPTSNIIDGVYDDIFLEVTVTDGDGDSAQKSMTVNTMAPQPL